MILFVKDIYASKTHSYLQSYCLCKHRKYEGCILMVDKNENISSHFLLQDYIDGFDKLLRLGLKNQQEREIIHIIVDLCLQEKKFNPFYVLLLQKFCLYHRRFQVCFVLCGTMYCIQFNKIYCTSFLDFFSFY